MAGWLRDGNAEVTMMFPPKTPGRNLGVMAVGQLQDRQP
jgi:hypothetical protein